jgi:HPt (histidine-containing phosphotransfer) domain-containing protein
MAYTDLTYLKSVAEGNNEIVREMIGLFNAQVPEFIANLNTFLKEKRYLELGKEAHKAKSSVLVMGMEELAVDMKTLQLATIDGIEEDKYPEYVQKFETQCLAAVAELNEELKNL